MARKRPAAVVVLAVLHFVFGAISLCFGACGGAAAVMPWYQIEAALEGSNDPEAAAADEREAQFFRERLPYKAAFEYASLPLDVLMPVALMAAGVGLLRLRPWGRWLSLAYAVIGLLHGLAYAVYHFVFYFPVQQEYWRLEDPAGMGGPAGTAGVVAVQGFAVLATLFFLAYPVAILIVLTRPNVAAAFRPEEKSEPGTSPPRPAS